MDPDELGGATWAVPGEGGSYYCEVCHELVDGIRTPGLSDEDAAGRAIDEHWRAAGHGPVPE